MNAGWGKHPIALADVRAYRNVMKTKHQKKKTLTLGELIASVYGICGKRHARDILRFIFDAHIVTFSGHHRHAVMG